MCDNGIFVFGSKIFPEEKRDAISRLPLELSWKIFSYLDDVALRNASRAYKKWHWIIFSHLELKRRLNHFEFVIKLGSESLVTFHRRNRRILKKVRRHFLPTSSAVLKSTKTTVNSKRGGDEIVVCTKRFKLF
ncbi:uncharacterized protein LOC128676118 [Plodia interpunctella]|uniref:uncharacterized protein LOC128676118 n=1 Tax=Plodia interpunctella TaxID=58824 RepID=UPI002367B397|nr:uncharacterized protein LOC128676118 [Plodia interpunctella]